MMDPFLLLVTSSKAPVTTSFLLLEAMHLFLPTPTCAKPERGAAVRGAAFEIVVVQLSFVQTYSAVQFSIQRSKKVWLIRCCCLFGSFRNVRRDCTEW